MPSYGTAMLGYCECASSSGVVTELSIRAGCVPSLSPQVIQVLRQVSVV